MLFHISFLEIPLCYKVPIQTVKVKIDVHTLSGKRKKPKKTNFITFMKERRSFFSTLPETVRKLWYFVEWTICTERSFFWKSQRWHHEVFIEKISEVTDIFSMAARTTRQAAISTSGTITIFLNVQLKKN